MLNDFIQMHRGKLVSFDGVQEHAGDNMQLIATWCKYIGLPFRWPLPRDWCNQHNDNFDEYWMYFRVVDMNDTDRPQPGDIVIFEDNLPGSDGKGHASIFVEDDGVNWRGFDSDWEGEVAHMQYHDWMFVRGWFTPNEPLYERTASRLSNPVLSRSNLSNMTSPVRVGNSQDTIFIEGKIPMYSTMSQALDRRHNIGWVPIHKYYVYRRFNGMLHLTRNLGQPSGIWINPADLEPKPVVITSADLPVIESEPERPAILEDIAAKTASVPLRHVSYVAPSTKDINAHYGKLVLKMLKFSQVMKTLREKYKESK